MRLFLAVLVVRAFTLALSRRRYRREFLRQLLESGMAITWQEMVNTPRAGAVVLNRGWEEVPGYRLWWIPERNQRDSPPPR